MTNKIILDRHTSLVTSKLWDLGHFAKCLLFTVLDLYSRQFSSYYDHKSGWL